MALLPIRPMLLRQHRELRLDLDPAAISRTLHCVLLPFAWLCRHSYRHMALGHGVPRCGEGHVDVHSHLSALRAVYHPVRTTRIL